MNLRCIIRTNTWCFLLLLPVFGVVAGEIECLETWGTVFGGKEVTWHVKGSPEQPGQMTWRLSAASATLARGEVVWTGGAEPVSIVTPVPAVKEGVVFPARLEVTLVTYNKDKPLVWARDLFVFADDPLVNRREWVRSLSLHLFDPAGNTATCFKDHEIPFEAVHKVSAITELQKGLLIIGEGLSFAEHKGLDAVLYQAAARGVQVLILAPAEGECFLAGTLEDAAGYPAPKAVKMADVGIIRTLDKRLDAEGWAPDGVIADTRMRLRGDRGPVVVEFGKGGGEGWVWLDLDYHPTGKRLQLCGFPIIRKWNDTPSARNLFATLLEGVYRESLCTGSIVE